MSAVRSLSAFPDAHGTFAAASAHLGHLAEARAGLDEFMRTAGRKWWST